MADTGHKSKEAEIRTPLLQKGIHGVSLAYCFHLMFPFRLHSDLIEVGCGLHCLLRETGLTDGLGPSVDVVGNIVKPRRISHFNSGGPP